MIAKFRAEAAHGWRLFWQTPWLSLAALLTLAIGIGVNTAVFSLVNQLMLAPPPGKYASRSVVIGIRDRKEGWFGNIGAKEVPAVLPRLTSYESLGCATDFWLTLTGGSEPLRTRGLRAGPGFLATIGIETALGRTFDDRDFADGAPPVCIMTQSVWRNHFGADPSVLGKTLGVNGVPHTVVGVFQRGVRFEDYVFDVTVSSTLREPNFEGSYNPWWPIVGRLRSDVTRAQAFAEWAAIYSSLPDTEMRKAVETAPALKSLSALGDPWVERQVSAIHLVAAFILLICIFNVANLLLVKARQRWREMAIRSALGASPRALWWQAFAEQTWLAGLSTAVGLVAGWLTIRVAVHRFAGADWGILARLHSEITLDWRVLLFASAAGFLTVLLVGWGPALLASRTQVAEILKEGGRGASEGRGLRRCRSLLVGIQLGLTSMLLVLGGLHLLSFGRVNRYDYGLRVAGLVQAQVDLPFYRYESGRDKRLAATMLQLGDRLRELPGVKSVAFSQGFPAWAWGIPMRMPDTPPNAPIKEWPLTAFAAGAGDFFQTFQLPLLRGEYFQPHHNQPGVEPVCLVGEGMVKRYFKGIDPIGRYLEYPEWGLTFRGPFRIIGVTRDLNRFWLDKQFEQIYIPFVHLPEPFAGFFFLDVTGDPQPYFQRLRETIHREQPECAIRHVGMLEDFLREQDSSFQFIVCAQVLFASLGLILSAIGVFGVVSYNVSQRDQEIGIRMALGARPRDVRRQILREVGWILGPALLMGLGLAALLAPLLKDHLPLVHLRDPWVYGGAALMVTALTLASCWWPAWRASRCHPARLLTGK